MKIKILLITVLLLLSTMSTIAKEAVITTLNNSISDNGKYVLACGDTNADKKSEIVVLGEYVGSLNIYFGQEKLLLDRLPSMYGTVASIMVADLNKNGISEIIVSHGGVENHKEDPAVYIIEKIGKDYKVIWRSSFFGYVSRLLVSEDTLFVLTDDQLDNYDLVTIRFENGRYQIVDSKKVDGPVVYAGSLGNGNNVILVATGKSEHYGHLYNYRIQPTYTSFTSIKVLESENGVIKESKKNYSFPRKDIWGFETGDIDRDGIKEVVIGVYDGDKANVEVYKWHNNDYKLLGSVNAGAADSFAKGLALGDIDGNKDMEILTCSGYLIDWANNHLVSLKVPILNKTFSSIYLIYPMDRDFDGKQEFALIGFPRDRDIEDYSGALCVVSF